MTKTSQMIREVSWGQNSNYFIKLIEHELTNDSNGTKTIIYSIEFMSPCIEYLCKKCETTYSSLCECEGWMHERNKLDNPTLLIGNHIQDMHGIFDNMSTHLDVISKIDRKLFVNWIEENIKNIKEVTIFCDYYTL